MPEDADLWISAKPIDAGLWRVTVNPLEHQEESDGPPLDALRVTTELRGWGGLEELDGELLDAGYRRCTPWRNGTARGWVCRAAVEMTDATLRALLEIEEAG